MFLKFIKEYTLPRLSRRDCIMSYYKHIFRLGFLQSRGLSSKPTTILKCLARIDRLNKHERFSRSCHTSKVNSSLKPNYINISETFQPEDCDCLFRDMIVYDNFLTESEEKALFDEVEPHIIRLPYEYDHWDNAIHGFRETERLVWSQPCTRILDRVRNEAFPAGKSQLKYVHVLDLSKDGYIKPHIDSIKFCGDTIAGLSLLSDSVMRLVHDKDKTKVADVLLKQRSLYIMRNSARYDYTHEILGKESSRFNNVIVPRGRRISVICRSDI